MRGPKVWVIGHRRVFCIEALRWSIEQTKTFGRDPGNDFSSNTAPGPGFAHSEKTPGACHRGHHGVGVEWFHRTKIYNFDFRAFGGQLFSSRERILNHGTIGNNRHVPTRSRYSSFADRHGLGGKPVGFEV